MKGIAWLAVAAVGVLGFQELETRQGNSQCKCYPGDKCWPSTSDWNKLNTTVGGRLVRAIPPGAACYDSFEGIPTRDPAKCAEVAQQWSNASWA